MQIKKALRWTFFSSAITLTAVATGLLIANEFDEAPKVAVARWPPASSEQARKGFLLLLGLAGDAGEDQLAAGEKAEKEIAADPAASQLRQRWDRLNARLIHRFFDSRYRNSAYVEKNRAEIDTAMSSVHEDLERYFALVQNGVADVDLTKNAARTSSNGIHLLQVSKAVAMRWNQQLAGGQFGQVISEAQAVWRFDRANLELKSSLLQTMIGLAALRHVREFINDAGYDNPAFRKVLTPKVLATFQTQIDPVKIMNQSREWELGWMNQMLLDPTVLGEPWNSPLSRHFITHSRNRILNSVSDLWETGMRGGEYERPWSLRLYPFAYGATTVLHFDLKQQMEKVRAKVADYCQPIAFTPPKVLVN